MPFPNRVNSVSGTAVEGDIASSNPRASVPSGQGSFVAGASGAIVGRFCWLVGGPVAAESNQVVSTSGAANVNGTKPLGFVGREMQAMITAFLAETSMQIPVGLPVTVFNGGDFWALNTGNLAAVRGDAVFAEIATGAIATSHVGDGTDLTTPANWQKTTFLASAVAPANTLVKISASPAE
jgi:hypothetical protein